jgi:cell division septation protein DedD
MASDRQEPDTSHELRLEGVGLLLGGGLLVALLFGAFFLGRWVERRAHPGDALPDAGTGPLSQVVDMEPDADAAEGETYFDAGGGDAMPLEPGREIQPRDAGQGESGRAESAEPPARPAAAPDPARKGDFYVQVLALRDRSAAAEVIESLKGRGYGVRLFSEREGQDLLYKVRVGGYTTREQAGVARDELRQSGHPGAFVWPTG